MKHFHLAVIIFAFCVVVFSFILGTGCGGEIKVDPSVSLSEIHSAASLSGSNYATGGSGYKAVQSIGAPTIKRPEQENEAKGYKVK